MTYSLSVEIPFYQDSSEFLCVNFKRNYSDFKKLKDKAQTDLCVFLQGQVELKEMNINVLKALPVLCWRISGVSFKILSKR
ncbi:hypothetical protein BCL90_3436 [Pedobacter alluvionis]|uniref:Uncharacterized protein n=1 Tax=Pedobacter alluvionis TaxID=475253 RepID=A0A497Y053_9SPHI|nr:hypothetical protein BCL90_3436 [Pedobacter alluvionis]